MVKFTTNTFKMITHSIFKLQDVVLYYLKMVMMALSYYNFKIIIIINDSVQLLSNVICWRYEIKLSSNFCLNKNIWIESIVLIMSNINMSFNNVIMTDLLYLFYCGFVYTWLYNWCFIMNLVKMFQGKANF